MKADGKDVKAITDLDAWWSEAQKTAEADKGPVEAAGLFGGRQALKLTSFVPATMAVCYLLLILYFKAKGGYKAVHVSASEKQQPNSTGLLSIIRMRGRSLNDRPRFVDTFTILSFDR